MTQKIADLIVRAKELGAPLEQVLEVCGNHVVCVQIALDVYNVTAI